MRYDSVVSNTKVRGTLALFGFLAILFVGSAVLLSHLVAEPAGAERVIVIPAGTSARVEAGEDVNILPPDLNFQLRDTLVLVNNDSTAHTVGPFTIGPGQRLSQRMSKVATFSAFCTLHADGSITIDISGT